MKLPDKETNYHCFSSKEDICSWVDEHYTKEGLYSLRHNKPLLWYKGNASKRMNSYLREIDRHPAISCNDELYLLAREVNRIVSNDVIPDDIIVYRFIDIKEFFIFLKLGFGNKPFEYKGLLSTTLSKELYAGNRKNFFVIEIRVPKGSKGIYIPEVLDETAEYEILMPFNTLLRQVGLFKYEAC